MSGSGAAVLKRRVKAARRRLYVVFLLCGFQIQMCEIEKEKDVYIKGDILMQKSRLKPAYLLYLQFVFNLSTFRRYPKQLPYSYNMRRYIG
jgi:hypothetical protein